MKVYGRCGARYSSASPEQLKRTVDLKALRVFMPSDLIDTTSIQGRQRIVSRLHGICRDMKQLADAGKPYDSKRHSDLWHFLQVERGELERLETARPHGRI